MTTKKVGVILAAGRGSRLKELGMVHPKPMVKVNGVTIITNLIENLIHADIHHIIIVIGYKAEKMRKHLRHFEKDIELTFIENKIYDKTNNIYSLWLAKEYLENGFYLFEADIFFDRSILNDFIEQSEENIILVDKFTPKMNGTVVDFDENKQITGMYLKRHQKDNFSYEDKYKTVNFYKISKNLAQTFFIDKLNYHINHQDTDSYYELIIEEAIERGETFYAFETGNRKWWEIDTQEDLEYTQQIFNKKSANCILYLTLHLLLFPNVFIGNPLESALRLRFSLK